MLVRAPREEEKQSTNTQRKKLEHSYGDKKQKNKDNIKNNSKYGYWALITTYIAICIYGLTAFLTLLEIIYGYNKVGVIGDDFGVVIFLPTIIVTWIIFFIRSYRAYKNLHILQINGLTKKAGWAIRGWIIPIISLRFPYVIMKETYKGYYLLSKNKDNKNKNDYKNSLYKIGFRWVLVIIGILITYIGPILFKDNTSIGYLLIDLVRGVVVLSSNIILYYIIKKIISLEGKEYK